MNLRNWTLIALILLSLPASAGPIHSSRPELLIAPPGAPPAVLTTPISHKRKRLMMINPSWLLAAESSGQNIQPGSTFKIQLFQDLVFDVVVDRAQFSSKNRFLVKGHVRDIPGSTVLLAFVNRVLAGSVHVDGVGKFEIRFAGQDQHWVVERKPRIGVFCEVQ